MRSKHVLAILALLSGLPAVAQVAPAAKVGGLPLSVGAGLSDYSVDYGPGRRMLGVSAWADYNIFRGIGIEAEGTSIFADKPQALSKMRQDTIKGGFVYKFHPVFKINPYVKVLGGLGSIDFPDRNPLYTHDTYGLAAAGAGAEYRVVRNLFVRADYEYERWSKFHGHHTLTPNGITIGATYYLRRIHRNY